MEKLKYAEVLFRPLKVGSLQLPNRIVMAPMTRGASPNGIPGPDVAAYYRRRAEGGVGLIFTEGTWASEDTAGYDAHIPRFFGADALEGWAQVVSEVHAAGGRIIPQLWHIGLAPKSDLEEVYGGRADTRPDPMGPSGLVNAGVKHGRAMTQADIDTVSQAYVDAAVNAYKLRFDGIELHAAHGYLIDEFFWDETNVRTDRYGGDVAQRARFGVEIIKEIRAHTSPSFPIVLRYSQWKLQDFKARPWPDPDVLGRFLAPLVDAGIDIFDCSQRRFWIAEFEGSDLNLAGWTQKLSGKPAISVGSVTLGEEFIETLLAGVPGPVRGIELLLERMERSEFDLIAVGRALIANADWPKKIRENRLVDLRPFSKTMLAKLT